MQDAASCLAKLEPLNPTFFSTPMGAVFAITDIQDIFRLEANDACVHLHIPVRPARAPLERLAVTDVSRKCIWWRRRCRTQFLNFVSFNIDNV